MLTGGVLGIVVAGSVLLLDTRFAALVFGLLFAVGVWEWAALAGLGSLRGLFAAAFLGFVLAVLGLGLPAGAIDAVLWLAALGWLGAFAAILRYPARPPAALSAALGLFALTAAWLSILRVHGAGTLGPGLILAGLAIVWSADIGAFFVGRRFGRIKLAPRVSPKKTWEGVAGGIGLASLAGAAAGLLLGLPLGLLVPVAATMALISVVGDLSVSLLKRWAGVKDAGVLLPGHGGVMDRFDGVTAALPFFALGLQFAHVLD